jgi:hypothetical protein
MSAPAKDSPLLENPARARTLTELAAEARRLWGASVERLPPDEYATMLLALACDRIVRSESRGFRRMAPLRLVAIDDAKLPHSDKV